MPFRTNYPDSKRFRLSGALINRQHAALNTLIQQGGRGYGESGGSHSARGTTSPPPQTVGVAKIVDAADTCAQSGEDDETVSAPCYSQNLYLAQFRAFNWSDEFWEHYPEDLPLDANPYFESDKKADPATDTLTGNSTDASKSPVTESTFQEAYGAIPAYEIGDVVPCYFDEVRQALVPLQSPHADVPAAEFIMKSTTTVGNIATWQKGQLDSFCQAYLEVKTPAAQGTWRAVGSLSWQIPYLDNLKLWYESRSGFAMFPATHGTQVRLRVLNSSDLSMVCNLAHLHLWGAGRMSKESEANWNLVEKKESGTVLSGWSLRTSAVGRFKDSPSFVPFLSGVIDIQYLDPKDEWIIGCDFGATLFPEPNQRQQTCLNLVTSIQCDEGKIENYCQRQVCWPPEVAQYMMLGETNCTNCQQQQGGGSGQ